MPGRSEDDLVIGKNELRAVGTLVVRYVTMSLHLPTGHSAKSVRTAMREVVRDPCPPS